VLGRQRRGSALTGTEAYHVPSAATLANPDSQGTNGFVTLLAIFTLHFIIQAALARWLTGDMATGGLASVAALLACAVWGAAVARRLVSNRWRPLAGVLALLLLLPALFVAAVAAECLVRPQCFG
jgi:hypothetical protein